jgi:hypothetical protein
MKKTFWLKQEAAEASNPKPRVMDKLVMKFRPGKKLRWDTDGTAVAENPIVLYAIATNGADVNSARCNFQFKKTVWYHGD